MSSDLNPQRHLAAHQDDPDVNRRAVRAILWRVDNAGLNPTEAMDWLRALGLDDTARDMQQAAQQRQEAS